MEGPISQDTTPVGARIPKKSRGPSDIQRYASHHQLLGVCNEIQKELEVMWEHGVTMHELVIIMNGYDLDGHFLDYVFKKVTSITGKL